MTVAGIAIAAAAWILGVLGGTVLGFRLAKATVDTWPVEVQGGQGGEAELFARLEGDLAKQRATRRCHPAGGGQ